MTFSFSPSDDVRHVIEDGVLFVTIDRAEKRNPLSLGVLDRLRLIFTDHAGNTEIKVAVVTGASNKAFASGGDLAELADYRSIEDAKAFSHHGRAALDAIRLFPVPVIARLNGLALGGGAELALACDQRIASTGAKIGFIHGRLAIAASWGGGNDLVRLLGPAAALRMMATAEILDANAALALGVIDAVCPADTEFDDWFAGELAAYRANPAQVMRAFKAIASSSRAPDRAQADTRATEHFSNVWAHQDHWDAVELLERKSR